MENWILIVGYDRPHFDAAQKEWVKFHVFLHFAVNAADAIEKFSSKRYLAVIASYDLPDMMSLIKVVRETKQIPFVVLSQEDSGTRIAESIIRGADTFIIDPDKLVESLTKNKDIIDRLSRLPAQNKQALGILTHRDIFMLIDYRKVFVRGKEVSLAKSEFEILQLLLSKAGWVFTHEQIYLYAYGEDVSDNIITNAVRCHISRIRQRLRIESEQENYIDSVRSIGYRIAV